MLLRVPEGRPRWNRQPRRAEPSTSQEVDGQHTGVGTLISETLLLGIINAPFGVLLMLEDKTIGEKCPSLEDARAIPHAF